jgi:hypothetical protein
MMLVRGLVERDRAGGLKMTQQGHEVFKAWSGADTLFLHHLMQELATETGVVTRHSEKGPPLSGGAKLLKNVLSVSTWSTQYRSLVTAEPNGPWSVDVDCMQRRADTRWANVAHQRRRAGASPSTSRGYRHQGNNFRTLNGVDCWDLCNRRRGRVHAGLGQRRFACVQGRQKTTGFCDTQVAAVALHPT